MWEFEHSVRAQASGERIWAIWTDVAHWPEWNPGVGRVYLEEPLTEGATGTIRAAGGPMSALRVVSVEPGKRLVTEVSQRLFRLRFEYELADSQGEELIVTHRARMTGIATPLLRHTIGARLKRSIPAAVAAVAELAARPQDRG
jgi:uncharacterized protein YndB with AHSA1/START domain